MARDVKAVVAETVSLYHRAFSSLPTPWEAALEEVRPELSQTCAIMDKLLRLPLESLYEGDRADLLAALGELQGLLGRIEGRDGGGAPTVPGEELMGAIRDTTGRLRRTTGKWGPVLNFMYGEV